MRKLLLSLSLLLVAGWAFARVTVVVGATGGSAAAASEVLGSATHSDIIFSAVNDNVYYSLYVATNTTPVTYAHFYCKSCGNEGYNIVLYTTGGVRVQNLNVFNDVDNAERWWNYPIGSTWNISPGTYALGINTQDGSWQPGHTGDGGSILRSTATYSGSGPGSIGVPGASFSSAGRITVILNNSAASPN
jgi:hypothetical protein